MLRILGTVKGKQVELPSLIEGVSPGTLTDYGPKGTEIIVFGYFKGKVGIWVSKKGITIDNGPIIRQLLSLDLQEEKILQPGESYSREVVRKSGEKVMVTFIREDM